jgi:hypothetical protein
MFLYTNCMTLQQALYSFCVGRYGRMILAVSAGLLAGDISHGLLFLPLFALCAGGSDCGCAGGGTGEGTGGTGGASSSPGTCACCESTCSDCCECGANSASSSPFLCTWNGKQFVFENDVVVAPRSLQNSPEEGKAAYEAERISDTYFIKNVNSAGNPIRLALKEIEPEETFIDRIALERVSYPTDSFLASNPSHSGAYLFKKTDAANRRGVATIELRRGATVETGVSSAYGSEGTETTLEEGETIEMRATVEGRTAPFVLLSSRYRDWVAGTIVALEAGMKKQTYRSPMQMVRAGVLIVMTALLWIGMGTTRHADAQDQGNINTLTSHFGYRTAHADAPPTASKSLLVDYFDWKEHRFVRADIIQPRAHTKTLEALPLPLAAVGGDRSVIVRVTATKRHTVDLLSLFVPQIVTTDKELSKETLTLTKAHHSRVEGELAGALNSNTPGVYTHLVPGDVLELSFAGGTHAASLEEESALRITFDGFYSRLSASSEALAGDWVSKLDADARTHLEGMYALREYHLPNRQPVKA